MSAPQVSVLMTVFNGGGFLAAAIESILRQSLEDFEFVIVDDASTDGSDAVLRQFAASDQRIRLFCNKTNSGQTACLNQGLSEARGQWIARQDADDLSLPGRLAAQSAHVEKFPDLVLLGVNGWIIDERGAYGGLIHVPLSDDGIRWSMPFQNPFIHTGVFFRREIPDGTLVRYCGDFRICQDWELWARLVDQGRAGNLPERLVCYRNRRDSLSHQFSESTQREGQVAAGSAWRKNFAGAPPSKATSAMLENFRQGLQPAEFREFSILHASARKDWLVLNPSRTEIRQAEAVQWLQAAGAMAFLSRAAACRAMFRAMATDPLWTFQAVWDRVWSMRRQRPIFSSR